jgi:hypothetical protein
MDTSTVEWFGVTSVRGLRLLQLDTIFEARSLKNDYAVLLLRHEIAAKGGSANSPPPRM